MDSLWLVLSIPGLLLAITAHEYGHARAAYALGDPTAKASGRMTLNPLAHMDWLGMAMLWLAHFGWARPVPVDPRYFRHPRRDMTLVALAGPAVNVALAAAMLWLRRGLDLSVTPAGAMILDAAMWYNIWLAAFNLLPIPPLDGSKVLAAALPPWAAYRFLQFERYGWIVLLAVVYLGWVGMIVNPISQAIARLLQVIVGGFQP